MEFLPTAIPEVLILAPKKIEDNRGFFTEVYRQDIFLSRGLILNFVQENHSLSRLPGTIRGLHFQTPPFAQDKLVRVVRGRIIDVAVDIRRKSPTYGRHIATELTAASLHQIYIPVGFAHGFCTLDPDTEVVYKVTSYYARQSDQGLLWNDPDLAINWPRDLAGFELSDKDRKHPALRDLPPYFE